MQGFTVTKKGINEYIKVHSIDGKNCIALGINNTHESNRLVIPFHKEKPPILYKPNAKPECIINFSWFKKSVRRLVNKPLQDEYYLKLGPDYPDDTYLFHIKPVRYLDVGSLNYPTYVETLKGIPGNNEKIKSISQELNYDYSELFEYFIIVKTDCHLKISFFGNDSNVLIVEKGQIKLLEWEEYNCIVQSRQIQYTNFNSCSRASRGSLL